MKAMVFPEVTIRARRSLKLPDMPVEQTRKSKKKKIGKTEPHSGSLLEPISPVVPNPPQQFRMP